MDNYAYLERLYAKWKLLVNSYGQIRTMLESSTELSEESIQQLNGLLDRIEEKKEKYFCMIINELTRLDDTEGEEYEKV